MNKKEYYNKIYNNKDTFKIWKKLSNGCYVATMGYSDENALILMKLLKSFEEQYGEEITYEAAKSELALYENRGKLFIYLDENMRPVSMNGVIYNEDNISVDFKSNDDRDLNCAYFYGLSTIRSFRGKGACSELVSFAIEYAYYNGFDFVYARTDLTNSNSEGIMKKHGMQICEDEDGIIAEWVDVTENTGDYRLHLWLALKDGIYLEKKEDGIIADRDSRCIKSESRILTVK